MYNFTLVAIHQRRRTRPGGSRVAGGDLNTAPGTPNVLPAGQFAVSVVFSKRTFLQRYLLDDGRSGCENNFFVKS